MNESFLFNSIHKYNRATRQTQRDGVLHAVGVHAALIQKRRSLLPELTQQERDRVLAFLRDFLQDQGLSRIVIKN